ncbi:MAG: polymer-forming cytoskeletal protein [Deltaproteobacteria bacterium]|nr:polymer-forming cytoskeletal protein [Deltaproteobacteria bacterium]
MTTGFGFPGSILVGHGLVVQGQVAGKADVTVDGRLEGRVDLAGTLTVGPSALVRAELHVRRAVVQGVVLGTVFASEAVELLHGCRVVGDLVTPEVVMEDGALFRGNVLTPEMAAARPPPTPEPAPPPPAPARVESRPPTPQPRPSTRPPSRSRPPAPATPPAPVAPSPAPTPVVVAPPVPVVERPAAPQPTERPAAPRERRKRAAPAEPTPAPAPARPALSLPPSEPPQARPLPGRGTAVSVRRR